MLDPRKLVAEGVGAFTLTFVGAGSIVLAAGNANLDNPVAIALAHGLAIGLSVLAMGHISGGHFNPAVTLGFWVTRRIETVLAIGYVVAQLAGAVVGAIALTVLYPEGMREAVNLGTPALGPGIDFMAGVGIEAILTFLLVAVIFGTAVDPRGPKTIAGLAIGLAITMDIFAAGSLTGAAMNPSRAFGVALISGTWTDQLVWWIGPAIGGVAGAMLHHYVFFEERAETM